MGFAYPTGPAVHEAVSHWRYRPQATRLYDAVSHGTVGYTRLQAASCQKLKAIQGYKPPAVRAIGSTLEYELDSRVRSGSAGAPRCRGLNPNYSA